MHVDSEIPPGQAPVSENRQADLQGDRRAQGRACTYVCGVGICV